MCENCKPRPQGVAASLDTADTSSALLVDSLREEIRRMKAVVEAAKSEHGGENFVSGCAVCAALDRRP